MAHLPARRRAALALPTGIALTACFCFMPSATAAPAGSPAASSTGTSATAPAASRTLRDSASASLAY
ncbi:hypothetical protein [Streptomyces beihaiensis]|uniref:Uncharacterized protein n=1 Tax=Streptomyces beihaiensis TaxID=2984495 RepID=A0ABT3U3R9_9ACTN|nr:hypothetical protein [Streptomyces beihaiensis]MCX3063984.1 hypothetical protein [Streptomyces beihaiensis]